MPKSQKTNKKQQTTNLHQPQLLTQQQLWLHLQQHLQHHLLRHRRLLQLLIQQLMYQVLTQLSLTKFQRNLMLLETIRIPQVQPLSLATQHLTLRKHSIVSKTTATCKSRAVLETHLLKACLPMLPVVKCCLGVSCWFWTLIGKDHLTITSFSSDE